MATLKQHQKANTLPEHLKPLVHRIDPDAEVPGHMADDPNWMNNGLPIEPVYVRLGDGKAHPITNRIHLHRLLTEDAGVIVPAPAGAAARLTPLGTHLSASQEG